MRGTEQEERFQAHADTRPRAYLGARVQIVNCPGRSGLGGVITGTAVHETAPGSSELCRGCWIVRLDRPLELIHVGDETPFSSRSAGTVSSLLVHDDNIELDPPAVIEPCRSCGREAELTPDQHASGCALRILTGK